MVKLNGEPTSPGSPAQQLRYSRILQGATAMLTAGGENALQMKELAARAEVSLATLYRYFPSKDHLLLRLAYDRYDGALRRVSTEPPQGTTPGQRVADLLLREFRAMQREPEVTAALTRALTETNRNHSEMLEAVAQRHQQVVLTAAERGGPLDADQRRLLPLIMGVAASAARSWLNGVRAAADARFEMAFAGRLLDLPADVLRDYVAHAEAQGAGALTGRSG